MNTNTIPKSQAEVANLALRALAGTQVHGATLGVTHNSADKQAADLFALIGDPATPLVAGKQPLLNAQLTAMKTTYAAMQMALKAGRDFCHTALGVLKPILGQRWNGQWLTAGITSGSLAVPATPLALLLEFRGYFEAHPEHEAASLGLTAADAQAHIEGIQGAVQARETARGARWSVKAKRDAAFKQLRKRLSALRAELAQLMEPTDDRWYAFGFRRPADGKLPAPVGSVTLASVGAGKVLVSWPAAKAAEDYRVTWRVIGSSDPATPPKLCADLQCLLTGLPAGLEVIVSVSARNRSGDSVATEMIIRV